MLYFDSPLKKKGNMVYSNINNCVKVKIPYLKQPVKFPEIGGTKMKAILFVSLIAAAFAAPDPR